MTNTIMSAALEAAGVKQSMLTYYDLIDHLDELLMTGELKARVFNSLGWSIDMQCINAARNVFYTVYDHFVEVMGVRTSSNFERFIKAVSAGDNIDDFNFFESAMREQDHGKEIMAGMGLEQPAYATMVQLLTLRPLWHDAASKFATRPYEHMSLDARMASEQQQEVDSLSRSKLQMLAEFVGDGDDAQTKSALEMLTKSQQERYAKAFEMSRRIRPALSAILAHGANRSMLSDEDVAFHNLPLRTQYQFIVGAQRAVERSLSDLSSNRRISVMEFATFMKEGRAAMKALQDVTKNHKFANLDA